MFLLVGLFLLKESMASRRGKKHCQWQPADMERALEACREQGMKTAQAAREFSVPRKTLADRLSNKVNDSVRGAGSSTFLTPEEELSLCNFISFMAKRAFPLSIQQIINYAWCIDKKSGKNRFGSSGPSETWWKGFKGRHPEAVKLRKPDSLDRGRAIFGTVSRLRHYFQVLKTALEEGGFSDRPQDIYNCDETVVDLNKSSQKVVVPRRMRTSHSRPVATTEHISIHCCVSAAGNTIPPFIIFKGAFPGGNYTAGGPDGALYGRQQSGFMDGELFLKWLKKLFVPHAKPTAENPVLLLVDGHSFHCTCEVIEAARENHVVLLALAPHTTHLCQPLDVCVYKAFKVALSKLVRLGQSLRGDFWVTKTNVPRMIRAPFEQSMSITNIKSGFRKCGIHPFDPNAIDRSQLFRNNMIPREDIDLSIPPTEDEDQPEAEPERIPAELLPAVSEVVEEDLNQPSTSRSGNVTVDDELEFVSFAPPQQPEEVIDLSQEPDARVLQLVDNQDKTIIRIMTGLENKTPAYQFVGEEKIEVVAQDICGCGSGTGMPKTTCHPLVDAGIISPELASVFTPPEEYIPPGRKRALRVKSQARIMTGDEVYEDIRRQQEELREKERATPERKAALERKRAANRGRTNASTSSGRAGTSSTRTRGARRREPVEESSSDEEVQSLCISCSANYFSENPRLRGKWAGCDNCESWFCSDCLPENFNYNAEFKCDYC